MDASTLNSPLTGMSDVFGLPLRKRRFVTASLAGLARQNGYEQVEVPLVERASSFAEEVVGRSPWPEWDQRGCFYLTVPDYAGAYESEPASTSALLIPEGTISVTRWLGRLLAENPEFVFPLKLFYETPCFRNELVDALDSLKRRQFTQFGLEVLGAQSGTSDIEAMRLIAACLHRLGVPRRWVRLRVGDVAVFNRLVELSGLSADDAIPLKETLDAVAECKAGKHPERRPGLIERAGDLMRDAEVDERWSKAWLDLVGTDQSLEVVESVEDAVITDRLGRLRQLTDALGHLGVNASIDLCVVRSHEYYTGVAFEIDVKAGDELAVEVGGGGRYDRLITHFLPGQNTRGVPATGFAFGVERLVYLLDRLDLLDADRSAQDIVGLRSAVADVLLIPGSGLDGYLDAVRAADEHHAADRSTDVFLGAPENGAVYAAARSIPRTQSLLTP